MKFNCLKSTPLTIFTYQNGLAKSNLYGTSECPTKNDQDIDQTYPVMI